jgi:hypothetical protein
VPNSLLLPAKQQNLPLFGGRFFCANLTSYQLTTLKMAIKSTLEKFGRVWGFQSKVLQSVHYQGNIKRVKHVND